MPPLVNFKPPVPYWTTSDGIAVRLYCGDALEILSGQLSGWRYACAFLDPPDAIGLKSEGYVEWPRQDYAGKVTEVMEAVIPRCGVTWLSYNAVWDLVVKHWAYRYGEKHPGLEIKPFVWVFTFGQNRNSDCGPGHRPILRFRHKDAPLYPDQIKVASWRQSNGDKRAKEGGKVPLDAWTEFPRVVGNAKERRPWSPTQHPEALVERAIKLSTREGDEVLDLFSGSGTAIRACRRIGRRVTSVEISPEYCRRIAEEHGLARIGYNRKRKREKQ
jgi:hypothetical protein